MSLINFDSSGDPWLGEYEGISRLHREVVDLLDSRALVPRDSSEYNSLSGSVRVRLRQILNEAKQLSLALDQTTLLTGAEKERRRRLVESLLSQHMQLSSRLDDHRGRAVDDRQRLLGDGGVGPWMGGPDAATPLLSDVDLTPDQLRDRQQNMLTEQDAGLERLSNIIGRQKNIAITIGNEVDSQNDLVENISNHMERTNSSLNKESQHVVAVSTSDSTWGYWGVIIILFIAILVVSFAL